MNASWRFEAMPFAQNQLIQRFRPGMSLVELVIAMGLLSLLMLPVIGLLATTTKLSNASSAARSGTYARHAALEVVGQRLGSAERVINSADRSVSLLLMNGETVELVFSNGSLEWRSVAGSEILVQGLSDVSFQVGVGNGGSPTAGTLLRLEVASRQPGEPNETWSSTQLWVRPAI